MAERHVEALFATAFDARLDTAARRRFDQHLAGCEQCAAAFADHCAAAEALRSLPAARMPVPVRLPMHPPRAAHRGLLERLPRASWGMTLTTAGAAAAIVLVALVALNANRGSGPSTEAARAVAGSVSTSASGARGALSPDIAQLGSPAPAQAGSAPAPYGNVGTAARPGAPDQVLVLATVSSAYAPGQAVTINARLVRVQPQPTIAGAPAAPGSAAFDAPQRAAIGAPVLAQPSVSLLAPPPSALQAGVPASPSPIAAIPSGAPGMFIVNIPPTAVRGQVLTIVATVPAGVPSGSDTAAVTVALQITVS